MPVATENTINLIANDESTNPIDSVDITVAPPDPSTEGSVSFSGPPINGDVTFTPAPRFLTSALYGYGITSSGLSASSVVKVNVDKTYSQTPAVLYINASAQVNYLNTSTLVTSPSVTLSQQATELASNRGDALLYFSNAFGAPDSIFVYDFITTLEFILLSKSSIGFTNTSEAMGFDNARYFLYVGFQTGSSIGKIAVNPYDRYNNPGTQGYSASLISLTDGGSPLSGFVSEITVEESTGFLFVTMRPVTNMFIYKINPITGVVLNSIDTGVTSAHISFANDGQLYAIFNTTGQLHQVNTTTLAISPAIGAAPQVTDMSELLFNM